MLNVVFNGNIASNALVFFNKDACALNDHALERKISTSLLVRLILKDVLSALLIIINVTCYNI